MPKPPRRSISGPQLQPQPQSEAAPGSAAPGEPVNPFSRAVNPRLQYPLHFDLLMRDLFARGLVPEHWQVVAADEVRLDETGMDVEFTLLEVGTERLWRRRVDVQHGKLVGIHES